MEPLHETNRVPHGPGDATKRWAQLQRARILRDGAMRYLKEHRLPQVKAVQTGCPRWPEAGIAACVVG